MSAVRKECKQVGNLFHHYSDRSQKRSQVHQDIIQEQLEKMVQKLLGGVCVCVWGGEQHKNTLHRHRYFKVNTNFFQNYPVKS